VECRSWRPYARGWSFWRFVEEDLAYAAELLAYDQSADVDQVAGCDVESFDQTDRYLEAA
jgi:hypothetical protein